MSVYTNDNIHIVIYSYENYTQPVIWLRVGSVQK